jgi:hypothetical protein
MPKKSGVSASGTIFFSWTCLIDNKLIIDNAPAAAKLAWAEKHTVTPFIKKIFSSCSVRPECFCPQKCIEG